MEELYSDFRCDVCSAPLLTRHPGEPEHGFDEASEYECGRVVGAPNGDVPCTLSPDFRRFDDFALTTIQQGDFWYCFAHWANARRGLNIGLNRTERQTEEEAKEDMRQQYLARAKPRRNH